MSMIGAIVGGALGGLVGAAIWAAVTYYSGWEISWIAWGIGGLVGLGVHLGGRRRGGIAPAGTAALLACAAVLLGKLAMVRIDLATFMGADEAPVSVIADIIVAEREHAGGFVPMPPEDMAESLRETYPPDVWAEARQRWEALDPSQQEAARTTPPLAAPEPWLVWLADEVVEDYQRRGRAVEWPPGMDLDSAWCEWDYPADVWSEAVTRWEAMSAAEQEAYKATVISEIVEMTAADKHEMLTWWFISSFSLFDILWIGLAVVTAAKIGYSGTGEIALPRPLEAETKGVHGSGFRVREKD